MESSEKPVGGGVVQEVSAESNSEKYILELQPAERGLKSQILEADLVLWTVGSKPLLLQLEPCDRPHELPLNARGQAETDETLRVKGHPRIFALGDSSTLRDSNGRALPATAQVRIVKWSQHLFIKILLLYCFAFRFNTNRHCLNLSQHPCQVAFQQADFAGWNLWAAINDRPLLPFRYLNCSLGCHHFFCSVFFLTIDICILILWDK